MKHAFIALSIFTLILVGCDKHSQDAKDRQQPSQDQKVEQIVAQPAPASSVQVKPSNPEIDYKAQFEKSDQKISRFMDQLDDPKTVQQDRIRILCKDWPEDYKSEYMPALLHLKPQEFTQPKLLEELKTATDYYKNSAGITCT